jgi:hypothetical protein
MHEALDNQIYAKFWFDGNYSEYEADRKARLGAAERPHRIKYRQLTRG